MRCENCQGTGKVREWWSLMGGELWADVPCPECGGSGIAHCCEGERPDDQRMAE